MAGAALLREIGEIPETLAAVLAAAPPQVAELWAPAAPAGGGTLWIVGNGTSLHAALGAEALHRRHAPAAGPRVVAAAAHGFLRHPPRLGPGDLVLGLSVSGESGDVLAVERAVRGTAPFVGLTNAPDSTLARTAALTLGLHAGVAQVPSTTKTYVASLAVLYLVVLALLDRQAAAPPEVRAGLDGLPAAARRVLARVAAPADRLAGDLAGARRCLVYGAGPLYPLALELALKCKEVAVLHAEAVETGEMLHGAMAVVDGDTRVVGLVGAPDSGAGARVARFAAALGGPPVLTIGPAGASLDTGEPLNEWLAPFLACIPGYLLARSAALARGVDPDMPDWYELYLHLTR